MSQERSRNRLSLRAHQWGPIVVVVASGEIDSETAPVLMDYIRRCQGSHAMIVDVWDVTRCETEGVAALRAVKQQVEKGRWGFAVVGDPSGLCVRTLRAETDSEILTFASRAAARLALQDA